MDISHENVHIQEYYDAGSVVETHAPVLLVQIVTRETDRGTLEAGK